MLRNAELLTRIEKTLENEASTSELKAQLNLDSSRKDKAQVDRLGYELETASATLARTMQELDDLKAANDVNGESTD
eukprot:7430532-Heterocapsa_arctica.AAC.1